MSKRLIGRKLYIEWNDNMYVAIEKIPDGAKKCAELNLIDEHHTELCNVYEDENGNKIEESLGAPAMKNYGYTIDVLFKHEDFWKTPGEAGYTNRE